MNKSTFPLQSLKDFLKTYTLLSGGTIDFEERLFICYQNPSTLFSRYILTSAVPAIETTSDASASCAACTSSHDAGKMDFTSLEQALTLITSAPAGELPVLVTYDEADMPSGVEEAFEKRGFEPYITQQGMVLDLSRAEKPEANPHVIHASADNIDLWSEALFDGFNGEKPYEPFVYRTLIGTPEMTFYGYYSDANFLGTTILYHDGANAGIHDVAVHPNHRRKGISRAIILQALYDMKKAGGTYISLQASPFGEYLYRSFGFESTSRIYTWKRP